MKGTDCTFTVYSISPKAVCRENWNSAAITVSANTNGRSSCKTHTAIVKEIKIVAKPAKRGGKNYFVRVELVNGRSADVWCDKEVVELIQTCTELGVEPFKSFTLERRTSEKTGAEYIAVVLKMFNDDEYFYFLPRATNTIVELLIAKAAQDETATPAKKG